VDSVSVRAKRRGELTGPSPTDRGKAGSKYHVLCDRNGLPLHALITGANTHDSTMLAPLLDANPGVRERRGQPGRPRRRPGKLHADKGADKGYDYPRCRRYLTRRGIGVRIARRGIEDSTRLGRVRWVVERTMSWLLDFRRLALRYDRSETTVCALLSLACALICHRRLVQHQ
jgi:transposase